MLCWICPECGRDCSPAVRECPFCAQREASTSGPVTSGVLALAEKVHEAPAAPLLDSATQQYLLFGSFNGESSNGHSVVHAETAVLPSLPAADDPPAPSGEALDNAAVDALVRPLVESAKAASAENPAPKQAPPMEVAPPAPAPPNATQSIPVKPAPFLPPVLK